MTWSLGRCVAKSLPKRFMKLIHNNMQIGDNVKRKDKLTGVWSAPFELKTQKEVEYHNDLKANGVDYVIIHPPKEFGCASCEG